MFLGDYFTHILNDIIIMLAQKGCSVCRAYVNYELTHISVDMKTTLFIQLCIHIKLL